MGGKSQSRIKCPRCRKQGILRLKQKGKNALVVYHYDKNRYQKGTNGTKSCYIASMDISTFKIFEKFFSSEDNRDEFEYFSRIWRNFKSGYRQEGKLKDIEFASEGLERFVLILNELRKVKGIQEKINKVKGQRLWWTIRCPRCRIGIELHATFQGVDRKKPIGLDSVPRTRLWSRKLDSPNDISLSPFFYTFQPFPVVSSL